MRVLSLLLMYTFLFTVPALVHASSHDCKNRLQILSQEKNTSYLGVHLGAISK